MDNKLADFLNPENTLSLFDKAVAYVEVGDYQRALWLIQLASLHSLDAVCDFVIGFIVYQTPIPYSFFACLLDCLDNAYDVSTGEHPEYFQQLFLKAYRRQISYEVHSGLSFHNIEILAGRLAALGDREFLEFFHERLSADKDLQSIGSYLMIAGHEAEMSRWEEEGAHGNKSLEHIKSAFIKALKIKEFQASPIFFVDFLSTCLREIVWLLDRKKILLGPCKECFEAFHKAAQKFGCEEDFFESIDLFQSAQERAEKQMSDVVWFEYLFNESLQLQVSSKEPHLKLHYLDKALTCAIEAARRDPSVGRKLLLTLLPSLFS